MKKVISVALAVIMCFTMAAIGFASSGDYEITNPYASVDWATVNTYKTGLHSHTNSTDGDQTLFESLQRHAEAGFDIVAITDHGTINRTWAGDNSDSFIHGVLSAVGKSEGDIVYLEAEGTFANGMNYTYGTENGDDYLTLTDSGKKILRVPYGIENNAVSVNAHVNSWFVDYSDNSITQYEDAVSSVDALGGLCVINHPGEYTKARYELHSESAYNETNPAYAYYINKYADLLDKYDACLGIDINSKGDNRTRFDRKLWDILLTRFAARGENVYAICSSDAHQLSVIDTGYVQALAPSLTSNALRSALANGEFFGASHCIGNPDELYEIAAALREYYGETPLYYNVYNKAVEMTEKVEAIENGTLDADEDISITYKTLDDDGRATVEKDPKVTGISVAGDTITITSENSLLVRFISDGKLVATKKVSDASFCLSDYADEIGSYVRAEVFGEGGILYVQPFLINASEKDSSQKVTKNYLDLGLFDFLLAEINNFRNILVRFFSALLTKAC